MKTKLLISKPIVIMTIAFSWLTFMSANAQNPCQPNFFAIDTVPNDCKIGFLNNSQGGSAPTYYWSYGDGSPISFSVDGYHVYSTQGWYYVCLTMMDSLCPNNITYCDSVYVSCDSLSGIFENASNIGTIENFPNPFSHSTVISYSLKEKSEVNVSVYNYVGMKVAELENESREAGNHQLEWNAKNLNTGVYFLEIKSGRSVLSRKMVLIK